MKEFVEYLVKRLVKYPDEVSVDVRPDGEDGETIYVKVAESDVGKVIGRQGKIIMSMRTLVKAAATKQGKKYSVEIADGKSGKA
ncbi:MAG: KH domain-containing protein [Christensenellales bacterium]|jgi:RNA-binding protein (KH domain)|nr:KH domain-containing protein [Subdoligranulum sp.]CDE71483.1 uPF0109 protein SpiGrapes_0498 [Subdoligranulum sp. CAG:314]